MDVASLAHHFYAPAFSIQVGDKDLLKLGVEIFSVTVNNTLEGADDFSFTINNPIDPGANDFRYLKEMLFSLDCHDPKNEVIIKMGYGDRSKLVQVFSGIITAVDLTFPANGVSQMTIKGYDRSHKMMKELNQRTFGGKEPVSYSGIVKQIAACYKFTISNVADTQEKYRQIKKENGQSDYDFIKKNLAEKIGFEFFVIDKDLYFRPRKNDNKKTTAELTWGSTLVSFSPKINTAKQASEVQVRGWDPAKQKPIIGKAKSGKEKGKDVGEGTGGQAVGCSQSEGSGAVKYISEKVHNQKDADDRAKAILEKTALDFITGNGECLGLPGDFKKGGENEPAIIVGSSVNLKGLGNTFSKIYYVTKVTHSISTSGFKTTFEVAENSINEKTI
jgi:uncharacterized protein